jgi:tRNA-2-methylthio-N6-dimethylallyladenosine synthase
VDQIRAVRPDIALSSDFIVGFPGETDAEFEDTLRLAAEIRFASAFSFKYSPRPGTPAAEIEAQVPEPVAAERLARLQAQLEADRQAFNRGTVGQVVDLLIEKPGRHPGQLAGKSPYLQAIQVEGANARVGEMIAVRVTRAGSNSLFAEPAGVDGTQATRPLTVAA